jgi:MoaA/NifB/PqqE/SkfB family radical SAM enzyme
MHYSEIPEVYSGRFPAGYRTGVQGWDFSQQELSENKGKLLTMDIDFGGNNCFLNCPHCFRHHGLLDKNMEAKRKSSMSYEDTAEVVMQAKELGLKSVKFLGPGEPLQEPMFLEFLEFLDGEDIKSVLFTKGHIIGDDGLANRYQGHKGVKDGYDLAGKLMEYGVSPMVGFRYLNHEKEDRNVGFRGYAEKRDRALQILTDAGFNKSNPTMMGLTPLPVTKENYGDAFEIYKYGKRRNMCVIVTPTMISGLEERQRYFKGIDVTDEQKVDLYARIYEWNIENGLQTIEDVRREGVSSYAGESPCNQVACGMYMTTDGTVLRCPGDDFTVFGSVKDKPLKEIWEESENYRRAGTYNCGCPPKAGKTIPNGFYESVLERLESLQEK